VPAQHGDVVGQQLQRHDVEDGLQRLNSARHLQQQQGRQQNGRG
jgi:hypothetical protein